MWVLAIQTQIFGFIWQALYRLSHLPSLITNSYIYHKQCCWKNTKSQGSEQESSSSKDSVHAIGAKEVLEDGGWTQAVWMVEIMCLHRKKLSQNPLWVCLTF